MKKQYQPPTFSLMAMMLASSTEPMPEFMSNHQRNCALSSLEAILNGSKPTKDDWRAIADAINMLETLVIQGVVEDAERLLPVANDAMAEAAKRSQRGQGIRFDAVGMNVVRGVVLDYCDTLKFLTHRQVIACHRDTEKRIREIQAGKTQAHDIVVVSL